MGRPKGSKNKKTIEREMREQAKKAFKKAPLFVILVVLVIVCILGYLYFKDKQKTKEPNFVIGDDYIYLSEKDKIFDEMKVTFIELLDDNKKGKIGDSVFIEYGDVDILIDAGDKNEGSNTVVPFIEAHCEDDILELVIVTHADADHLGGMVGLSSSVGALEVPGITYMYLVDFGYVGDTKLYNDYVELRQSLIDNGTKYYDIADIFTNENNPSNFYLGKDATLSLLDYQTYANDEIDDDNDRSVSCLLVHQEHKFLLCGDAEKKEEVVLANLNIGHVDVFKSNHHGSSTSNSDALLSNITPNYVVICSSESNSYNLPEKVIINRLLNYTEKVFATFINGNVVFTSKNNELSVSCSKSSNDLYIQNSEWYNTDDPENPR